MRITSNPAFERGSGKKASCPYGSSAKCTLLAGFPSGRFGAATAGGMLGV